MINKYRFNLNKNPFLDKFGTYCVNDVNGEYENHLRCNIDYVNSLQMKFPNNCNIERLNNFIKINTIFRDIDIQNSCFNSFREQRNNINNIDIEKFIKSGVNGEVYLANIEGISVALKQQPLSDDEFKNFMILSLHNNTESWAEIYGMILLNNLYFYNISPHINLFYKYFICDSCIYDVGFLSKNPTREKAQKEGTDSPCIIMLNELAHGDLFSWLSKKHDEIEYYKMMFQLFYTLLCMQCVYGIIHSDCHHHNILYNEIEPGTVNSYSIFNILKLKVDNGNYLFKIYDVAKIASTDLYHRFYTKDIQSNPVEMINKDFKRILESFNNDDKGNYIIPDDVRKFIDLYITLFQNVITPYNRYILLIHLIEIIGIEIDQTTNDYTLLQLNYFQEFNTPEVIKTAISQLEEVKTGKLLKQTKSVSSYPLEIQKLIDDGIITLEEALLMM